MRDISTEIKVGMVVILAIVILLFSIVWIKDYQFGAKRIELVATFPQIGSLEIGDPVSVLGVDKGKVEAIELNGGRVLITLSLDNDVELKEDASITIANIGLMGERVVSITPGSLEKPYDISQPLYGEYDTGISEVFGMMGDVMTEVRSLIAALESTFGEKGEAENIRGLIGDLQELADNVNTFLEKNDEKINRTIADLSAGANKMRTFLDSNEVELNESAVNLAEFSESVTELTNRLNTMTSKIEQGEGTIGKTLADDSLYLDLRNMVNNLDSLITDFKENPRKYVKVSVF